jgi:hypothetical protein
VRTDKTVYKNRELVKITGCVVNLTGELGPALVEIRIARERVGEPHGDKTVFSKVRELTSGEFRDESYRIWLPGGPSRDCGVWVDFNLVVHAIQHGRKEGVWSSWSFATQSGICPSP